jgi:hypothetical protein
MRDATASGRVRCLGKVIAGVTADQRKYYGLSPEAFDAPAEGGRVLVLLSYP